MILNVKSNHWYFSRRLCVNEEVKIIVFFFTFREHSVLCVEIPTPKRQFRETNGGRGGGRRWGSGGDRAPGQSQRSWGELDQWGASLAPTLAASGTSIKRGHRTEGWEANFSNLPFLFLYSCFITFFQLNYIFWYLRPQLLRDAAPKIFLFYSRLQ